MADGSSPTSSIPVMKMHIVARSKKGLFHENLMFTREERPWEWETMKEQEKRLESKNEKFGL